jgi:hypothetical protein
VKYCWNSYQCLSTPCFVFAYKIKQLKLDLKSWNKEVFGNVKEKRKCLMEEIQSLNLLEEERPLVDEEIVKRALLKVVLMQEVCWGQKSRVTWLKERDHNTSSFHCLTNSHRSNNFISNLSIEGSDTSNQEVINDSIIQYYKSLFTEIVQWQPKLDGLEFPLMEKWTNWKDHFKRRKSVRRCLVRMAIKHQGQMASPLTSSNHVGN